MLPNETYKHFCALVVIVLIFALLFLVWRWPQGKHMTFSQHAAQHRSAIIYYLLVFTLVLPLLLQFFIGWFIPTFKLPQLFTLFIILATIFQYSVTIIPEVGGWKTTYHVTGATLSALCMLAALAILLFAPLIGTVAKVITAGGISTMVILLGIGAANKIQHPNLLLLQASYYVAFFAAILAATYIR